MRPLREPFASIVAGRPARVRLSGATLLGARLLTKELAFPEDEREAFGLRGLLPDGVLAIEEQVALEIEHLRRKSDDLERYIGLAALQDRNATLFYRVLADHLEELMPVVYTPTVGLACQQFSHILRRTRGIWITPGDIGRIPETLRSAPFEDVRLIVVTDNERILGLGDLGAGGMAIPIGKLALYSATSGIHPSLTLPVSLDVGTDSAELLADPLYLGHRAPRLRGQAYDELIEAFVEGVQDVWPGCLIQWEDFKGANALRILDRFADRAPSFNDDVQGTAAVTLAGLYAGARALGLGLADMRIVLAGAGAAGVGFVRLLRLALEKEGLTPDEQADRILVLDSRGLVHVGREDLDEVKRAVACPAALPGRLGLDVSGDRPPGLAEVVAAARPHALVGMTGQPGSFTEPVIHALAAGTARPLVLCLSNPSSRIEASPADVLRWSDGRAMVATGSPFPAVSQANNVFVFPGVGLGAMVSQARTLTQPMFLAAARTLAAQVGDDRLRGGALFPPVGALAAISRAIAIAVAAEAVRAGLAGIPDSTDLETLVDGATWRPAYVPYRRVAATRARTVSL